MQGKSDMIGWAGIETVYSPSACSPLQPETCILQCEENEKDGYILHRRSRQLYNSHGNIAWYGTARNAMQDEVQVIILGAQPVRDIIV